MQWGRSVLYFYVPMFSWNNFDGTDQENSKTQGGRRQIRKIQENKKEMMEERKRRERSLLMWRFPYSCVCHWLGMPRTTTLVRPSVRRTHSYGNLPYNITRLEKNTAPPVLINPCIQVINTSDSIKCQVQVPQAIIILFI